jgi:MoxR-like ATPase
VELSVEQKKELETVERFHAELKKIDHEIRKIIVGQKDVVDQVLISMLSGGHSIITGVPGLAKTLLIATVAHQTNPVHPGLDAGRHHRHGNDRRRPRYR